MLDVRLTGTTQADLQRLSKKLRTHGDAKTIRRELTRGLREGVKPVERDVKAAALRLPAAGRSGSTGLRKRIAASTGTQVRLTGRTAGVRVRVSKKRMGGDRIVTTAAGGVRLVGDQGMLPRRMNRGRWRHPVFGRDVWVTQISARVRWFDNVNRAAAPMVRRSVQKVLDDLERKLR